MLKECLHTPGLNFPRSETQGRGVFTQVEDSVCRAGGEGNLPPTWWDSANLPSKQVSRDTWKFPAGDSQATTNRTYKVGPVNSGFHEGPMVSRLSYRCIGNNVTASGASQDSLHI